MDPVALLSFCRAVAIENGSLIGGLFFAGLAGSLAHCGPMCGPFVLAQVTARLEKMPAADMREFHRLRGAALLPYHLGRASTYAVLGALAAGLSGGLARMAGWHWLPGALLALAALSFLMLALARWVPFFAARSGSESRASALFGGLARPLFADPTGGRGFLLGLVLGFLPCGLLYGALAAAAGAGQALGGAFAMTAFALGTFPGLLLVGWIGHYAAARWRAWADLAGPILWLVNSVFLAYLSFRLIAG